MNLELNDDERALLAHILADRIGTVRGEVRHTRTHEFREELRREKETLCNLLERIEPNYRFGEPERLAS